MLALFIVSGTGLAFEITLTRIFSLFFQYHFAFLAVSLAVLGLSLGAAWGHFRTRPTTRTLVFILMALGAGVPRNRRDPVPLSFRRIGGAAHARSADPFHPDRFFCRAHLRAFFERSAACCMGPI